MPRGPMPEIIRQKQWTPEDLRRGGFRKYERQKALVMARKLPESEAPLTIKFEYETVQVQAGYVICYNPGTQVRLKLNEYDHWPVRPDLFFSSYKPWDVVGWTPSAPQQHLMRLGCKPCYKFQGVWAKLVSTPTQVQSVESPAPVMVPKGAWILIGGSGEPYAQSDPLFRSHYVVPESVL
jgi:hypothetical protein